MPPNETAIKNAKMVIDALGRKPHDLRPSVEEGVYISFKNGNLGVFIECYNDGEIGHTLTRNRKPVSSMDMIAEKMNQMEFIGQIQNYLNQKKVRATKPKT